MDEEIFPTDELLNTGELMNMVVEEEKPVIGGLFADVLKLFFSDHNVMAVIITAIGMVTLLILATDFLKRRW